MKIMWNLVVQDYIFIRISGINSDILFVWEWNLIIRTLEMRF